MYYFTHLNILEIQHVQNCGKCGALFFGSMFESVEHCCFKTFLWTTGSTTMCCKLFLGFFEPISFLKWRNPRHPSTYRIPLLHPTTLLGDTSELPVFLSELHLGAKDREYSVSCLWIMHGWSYVQQAYKFKELLCYRETPELKEARLGKEECEWHIF